jgi:glycosyltransferase involved in cell wall biosynthesis
MRGKNKKWTLGIIMPGLNEASHLKTDVLRVYNYMKKNFKIKFEIIISDTSSTDDTPKIAMKLAKKYKEIKYNQLNKKGKGLGVKSGVMSYNYDWYILYDTDLPVEPKFLKPMIKLIETEKYDLICANRHGKGAKLITSTKRKIISFGTTLMVNFVMLNFKIKDTQAGFKAWNQKVKKQVWPLIQDTKFFFDVELIHISYKKRLKLAYLPVVYTIKEDKKGGSTVNLFRDITQSLTQLIKLRFRKI